MEYESPARLLEFAVLAEEETDPARINVGRVTEVQECAPFEDDGAEQVLDGVFAGDQIVLRDVALATDAGQFVGMRDQRKLHGRVSAESVGIGRVRVNRS